MFAHVRLAHPVFLWSTNQKESKNDLFFTAGIPGDGMVEDHGLFGSIVPTPEPGTFALLGIGLLVLIGTARVRKKAAIA